MESPFSEEQLSLFASLFRGREDSYAKRREWDGGSGYFPSWDVNWNGYDEHRDKGGTFDEWPHKKKFRYNDKAIVKHLSGLEFCGIYPLLEDNTSHFIAVDFDKEGWRESIITLHGKCSEYGIQSCIERSRSGNGGHLWIFFENAFPAEQSRKILFELLRQVGIISQFQKETGFDRLFPSQDQLSKKGMGNLIALPLNGKSVQEGNTCFLNPETLETYPDQWEFLDSIKKTSHTQLETIYAKLFSEILPDRIVSFSEPGKPYELEIILKNQVYLKRRQLGKKLVLYLRENLNLMNSDYLLRERMGFSTWKIEKYFNIVEESDEEIMIPRGFIADLVAYCRKENLAFKIIDQRFKKDEILMKSDIELRPWQTEVMQKVAEKDFGVIVMPPAAGKTIMGLEIIVEKKQPALILVHKNQIYDQWMDRIQSFLKIPKSEIGQIGNQKLILGKEITVAMIQTLHRHENLSEFSDSFGTIIVDECHHIPAKSFREVIVHFNPYYLYGLTATPERKSNDEKLIFVYIGKILYRLDQDDDLKERNINTEINIRNTDLFAPFDPGIDKYEIISRILIHDTRRNSLIIEDIEKNADRFKSILVLSERKDHVEILNMYLRDKFETITIHGEDSERSRKSKTEQIKQGHFKIVISTGQYFGEGVDINNLECLFIVYPFAFKGKLIQYIGRIQRSEKPPVIFDYRDHRIEYFEKMFKKRNRYYKKLQNKPVDAVQGRLMD